MTTSASSRLIVTKNGVERCVLSVRERPSGDLILNLRSADQRRANSVALENASIDAQHGKIIQTEKYSVHVSRDSPNLCTTIKLTSVLADGQTLETFNFTSSIKRDNLFTPIYGRRCSTLASSRYDIRKNNATTISMGEIGTKLTLVFAVFVGPSDRTFDVSGGSDFRVLQTSFGEFRLVVMWSFLLLPPHDSGAFYHIATVPGMSGISADERSCVEIFDTIRVQLKKEFVATLKNWMGSTQINRLVDYAIFVRDHEPSGPAYIQWLQSLKALGVL